jgi:hypothetical protein
MPPSPAPATPPTPRWQSIATVLLILHFFALGVGVVINLGGGRSLLGPSLSRVPLVKPYLQFLQMDLSYSFPLAGAGEDDGIHRLQLLRAGAEPADDSAVLAELPSSGMALRIRRQRYQNLAKQIALFDAAYDQSNDLRTEIPLGMVERWTKAEGLPAGDYTLRCLRIPSERLPQAVATEITYSYVMREGGLQQQAVKKPPPPPVVIRLMWDPLEGRYQGTREAAEGLRAFVTEAKQLAPGQ